MDEKKEEIKGFSIGVTVRKRLSETPQEKEIQYNEESTSISIFDEDSHRRFVESIFAVFK